MSVESPSKFIDKHRLMAAYLAAESRVNVAEKILRHSMHLYHERGQPPELAKKIEIYFVSYEQEQNQFIHIKKILHKYVDPRLLQVFDIK